MSDFGSDFSRRINSQSSSNYYFKELKKWFLIKSGPFFYIYISEMPNFKIQSVFSYDKNGKTHF